MDDKTLIITLMAMMGIASGLTGTYIQSHRIERETSRLVKQDAPFKYCITCLNTIDTAMSALLSALRDRTATGSCDTLCKVVSDKTKSDDTGAFCDLVCQAIAINEFITTVENADLDPIRYCEVVEICPGKIADYLLIVTIESISMQ
jgi:hypothetical protein